MVHRQSFYCFTPHSSFRSLILLFFLSFLLISSLFSQDAQAGQATLAWDPNTDSDLAGYKVYLGNASRSYQSSLDVGNKANATVTNLLAGATYYFAVTAYDSSRNESGYSNEVAYTIPAACTYSVSPVSQSFNSTGGTGSEGVTTPSGCTWTAVSSASWIMITSNVSATGSGTTYYSVSPNSGTSSRTGTLTIAGKAVTISQSGGSAQYNLNITKAGAGSGTVTNTPNGTTFKAGTSVALTAAPGANSTFAGWSGAYTGTSPTCTITMNGNASVTATFNLKAPATPPSNGIIGYNGPGSTTDYISDASGSYINLTRFQATANLNVKAIYAKVLGITGAYKCAIYSDNNGTPRNLLKASAEVTNPSTGRQMFSLPSAQTITAGQYYWLAIWSSRRSTNARVYCEPTGSTTRWTNALTYGTWPNPLTTTGGGSYKYCIYAQ